jgi:hypothetical protein
MVVAIGVADEEQLVVTAEAVAKDKDIIMVADKDMAMDVAVAGTVARTA